MNSIYFNEDHVMLRDQIRRFVEQRVMPVAKEWEESGKVPREILQEMGELGFLGIRYSGEYGGSEMDTLGSVILAEELGRSTFGGFAVTVLVHTDMASPHLDNFGNKDQLAKYMPDIISGKKIVGVAVTEPDVGSDVAAMKTRAVKDGDHYVLNGSKMFITNGVHGDLFFVAAKTDTDAKPSRGISIFAIEKGTPGFSVGKNLKKMGWLSSDTAELVFDNCRVPADNILGEVNKGFYSIMRNFQNERLVLGAQAMGEASKAIELTLDYVTSRKAFGGVLFDKQAIRQRLASLAARVEAGKQLVYHSAWLDTQGLDCIKEVSMAKAYCGELVNEVMYDCLQFHGGFGYIRESAIERMYRDARIQSIGGGATEVMLEEVSKRMID
ncbi:MAG: acyl-CoA dehydrogenase family protein [Cycloclasticus sp.]|jgi:acyl-CoA dehydrogenase|nr:MAG: acyl-CoA dehydrogenase [Cycloclasticus sp. Phe_18]MEE4291068.1 acyl-CoA dehydrogenase family protein [Cycloclasticus sp.]